MCLHNPIIASIHILIWVRGTLPFHLPPEVGCFYPSKASSPCMNGSCPFVLLLLAIVPTILPPSCFINVSWTTSTGFELSYLKRTQTVLCVYLLLLCALLCLPLKAKLFISTVCIDPCSPSNLTQGRSLHNSATKGLIYNPSF